MKQFSFLIFTLALIFSLSSCKKKYTCKCTMTQGYGGYTQTVTEKHTIKAKNSVDAESQCNTYVNNSSYQNVNCYIE